MKSRREHSEAHDRGACAARDCTRPHYCRGYCRGHYVRMLRGRPVDGPLRTDVGARTNIGVGSCRVEELRRAAEEAGVSLWTYAGELLDTAVASGLRPPAERLPPRQRS